MKKKSLMLLFCIPFAFALGGFAACEDDCDHDFADTLSSDSQYHWYAATCEHTDVKGDQEPHKDADNDGVCDVCGYDGSHTHEYETEWTISQTHHWYAATCTHSVTKDKAEHVDEDNDGRCDVCLFDKGHVCEYVAEWSTNETKHWHATTDACDHAPVMEDHVDADSDCICDVCGYDYYDLTPVIETATSVNMFNLVNGGTYLSTDSDDNVYADYTYTFGVDYTCINISEYTNYHYTYVDGLNDEKVFIALTESISDSTFTRNTSAKSEAMAGAYVSHGYIPDSYYGAEGFVSGLYSFAKANTDGDIYCYSDGYDSESEEYYFTFFRASNGGIKYTVSFSLSEGGALENVQVEVNLYSSSSWLVNTATKEILFTADAAPWDNYYFTFEQTIGERTATTPYADEISELLISELSFVDENGDEVGDTAITVNPYVEYQFPLSDELQEKYSFNKFSLVKYKKNAGEWVKDEWAFTSQYRTPEDGESSALLTFESYYEGEYKLVVSTEFCEKELLFTCAYADPSSITTTVNVNGYVVAATSATAYTNQEVSFMAQVNAGAVPKMHEATVTSEQAATAYALEQSDNDYYFTGYEVGTYTIKISSTINGFENSVYTEFTVTVVAPPTVEEILAAGKFKYETSNMNWDLITVEATFNNDTVVITEYTATYNRYWGEYNEAELTGTETMTYTVNGYDFTFTHSDGDELGYEFTISSDYKLCLYMNSYEYEMSPWNGDFFGWQDEVLYRVQDTSTKASEDPWDRWLVTLNVDGTGSYAYTQYENYNDGWYTVEAATFTYTLAETDDGYTVTFTLDSGVTCDGFDASQGGTIAFNAEDGVSESTITITIDNAPKVIAYYDPNA